MISRENGRIQPRLSLGELRSGEIRMDIQQGPVPASLLPGYKRPEPVFRLPEPPPPPPAAPREPPEIKPSHPRSGASLQPIRDLQPLADLETRRAAVAACLTGRVWRTAWEIAQETGIHPEVVRTILRSSCAISRPVAEEQIKARGAHIEYAARGTPCETVYVPKPRRPRWTHAFCEVCEGVQEFVEAPLTDGTDMVCATCRSVIATLYRGTPRPATAGASQGGSS